MAIDQAAVLDALRQRLESVVVYEGEAEERLIAYAPSQPSPGEGGLPLEVTDLPAALVMPGRTIDYILQPGQHRHTYLVRVLVILGGGQYTETAFIGSPLPDRIIEKMVGNVTLGGAANSCLFQDCSGLVEITWGGTQYLGYEMQWRVSEQASASPATGV